jgi:hypothetical protein
MTQRMTQASSKEVKLSRPISSARAKDITPECFTVNEFCLAHRIGLNTYYKLRKAQKGPHEIHVGSKVLITRESAAAWRAALDAEAQNDTRHE